MLTHTIVCSILFTTKPPYMSESKIQIKIGPIEFSGEGNEEWLASQFDKILAKAADLVKLAPESDNSNDDTNLEPKKGGKTGGLVDLSMLNVATKLACKSGSDLLVAAAAYLRFVKGQTSFTRDEILKSMKDATGFYKANMNGNLTKILIQVVRNNELTQSATNVYSLHTDKEKMLNGILSK